MPAPRFTAWCVRAFLALIAISAAAAIALKGAPLLQKGTEALFARQAVQEADAPAPEASPEALPMPTPKAPLYAAIVYKGEVLAVLEDAKSANTALAMALEEAADRAAAAAGGEAVASAFLVSPAVMPAEEGKKPLSVEEAAAALGAEDSPLETTVTVRTVKIERVAFETKTEKDASLMLGTRVIKSFGRDGLVQTEFYTLVRNGAAGEAVQGPKTMLRESVAREIVVGREPVADKGETPGRNEGKKGREPEGLSFAAPVDARITANFGGADGGYHYGVDYKTDEGGAVLAPEKGVVVAVLERAGYGLVVEIDHGQGFVTRCAKLGEALVAVGQQIGKGDAIGTAGKEELHFEIRIDGMAFNPRYYLK
ncbi:MAG: peptidoglycan DD-metalloendopeptidase family protein [Bacillota bacterium]